MNRSSLTLALPAAFGLLAAPVAAQQTGVADNGRTEFLRKRLLER